MLNSFRCPFLFNLPCPARWSPHSTGLGLSYLYKHSLPLGGSPSVLSPKALLLPDTLTLHETLEGKVVVCFQRLNLQSLPSAQPSQAIAYSWVRTFFHVWIERGSSPHPSSFPRPGPCGYALFYIMKTCLVRGHVLLISSINDVEEAEVHDTAYGEHFTYYS